MMAEILDGSLFMIYFRPSSIGSETHCAGERSVIHFPCIVPFIITSIILTLPVRPENLLMALQ